VKQFQKANKLTADGLAGKKTQSLILEAAGSKSGENNKEENNSSGNLFSGNYATLRRGDTGARVRILQKALIDLKYLSGKADGTFGKKTQSALITFQKKSGLTADGVAGKKTLKALEAAVKNGKTNSSASEETKDPEETEPEKKEETPVEPEKTVGPKAPDGSTIQLLHWFDDIKKNLASKQHLLIYDPSTGISWTLQVYSRGNHCDCEPLTKEDTQNMVKAFGGVNTWNQKGVYVKLPSGVWTVGSTHDMPHMSGSIKDNGFNGHLCVHFLRDMSEAKKNDPNYGVANQETIRALWKSISGQEITK